MMKARKSAVEAISLAVLRERAEVIFQENAAQFPNEPQTVPIEERRQILRELRICQIELEIQNEELRRAVAGWNAAEADNQIEAALKESEERYQRITQAVTDYIYTVRVENGEAVETTHGPGCQSVTGYQADEFRHDSFLWHRMVMEEDRPTVEEQARRILAGDDPPPIEHRIRHKSGAVRWVRNTFVPHRNEHGALTAYDGLIQDVTDRKQAENAIAALALRNQTLLQTASDGIHVLDERGNIVEANAAFCQMLGYTREEMMCLNVADWDARWSRDELLAGVSRLIARPAVFETRHRQKNGGIRDVEINSVGVTLEGNNYLYASARDITERKLATAENARLATQNQQLQKTESLGRMAGAVAHHFNNQLQSVMMRLEMAMNDLPRNIEPVESLIEAMKSARKAAEVSTQMLTYLGHSFDHKESLDLTEVCTQYLPLIHAVKPRTVIFKTDLSSPGPTVNASANQIHQVLTNLLTNAWEACIDSGNTVRLAIKTAAAADISGVNRFPLDWQPRENDYACLEVADTGCGIASHDIEKLFDPFFSSKFTGRGLGLSVVLGITRSHHGVCTVKSELGRGSVFSIYLPATAQSNLQ